MENNKIFLKDDYYFRTDAYGYILAKEILSKKKKTKETYIGEKIIAYCSTVPKVISALIKQLIYDNVDNGTLRSLQDIKIYLEKIEKELRDEFELKKE